MLVITLSRTHIAVAFRCPTRPVPRMRIKLFSAALAGFAQASVKSIRGAYEGRTTTLAPPAASAPGGDTVAQLVAYFEGLGSATTKLTARNSVDIDSPDADVEGVSTTVGTDGGSPTVPVTATTPVVTNTVSSPVSPIAEDKSTVGESPQVVTAAPVAATPSVAATAAAANVITDAVTEADSADTANHAAYMADLEGLVGYTVPLGEVPAPVHFYLGPKEGGESEDAAEDEWPTSDPSSPVVWQRRTSGPKRKKPSRVNLSSAARAVKYAALHAAVKDIMGLPGESDAVKQARARTAMVTAEVGPGGSSYDYSKKDSEVRSILNLTQNATAAVEVLAGKAAWTAKYKDDHWTAKYGPRGDPDAAAPSGPNDSWEARFEWLETVASHQLPKRGHSDDWTMAYFKNLFESSKPAWDPEVALAALAKKVAFTNVYYGLDYIDDEDDGVKPIKTDELGQATGVVMAEHAGTEPVVVDAKLAEGPSVNNVGVAATTEPTAVTEETAIGAPVVLIREAAVGEPVVVMGDAAIGEPAVAMRESAMTDPVVDEPVPPSESTVTGKWADESAELYESIDSLDSSDSGAKREIWNRKFYEVMGDEASVGSTDVGSDDWNDIMSTVIEEGEEETMPAKVGVSYIDHKYMTGGRVRLAVMNEYSDLPMMAPPPPVAPIGTIPRLVQPVVYLCNYPVIYPQSSMGCFGWLRRHRRRQDRFAR